MSEPDTDGSERVGTGIAELDEMLSGGLIPRSIAAFVGSYGTGKTTFALQFIWEGLRRGETAIYISFEETEEGIARMMALRGWDVQPYRNTSFFVLKLDPTNFNLTINTIRNELPPLIRKFSATRLIFDPISHFEELFESDAARRYEMFRLVEMLRDQHCTMVMTSETDRDNAGSSRHNLIEYLVDTVVLLRYVRPGGGSAARLTLEVVKMRLSPHSREIRAYEILQDRIALLPPGSA
jgi:KaiC domain protein